MVSIADRYAQEEDELLWTMLDKRFFSVWKDPDANRELWQGSSLELFITSDCNARCSYCYLHQHGDQLYPPEYRGYDIIFRNLRLIMEFIRDNDFQICELELFSGEIWHTDFGREVLHTILGYIRNGAMISNVMIPTNCTFALNDSGLQTMQDMVDQYREAGSQLTLSASIEGLALEDITRPITDGIRDGEFYHRLFSFMRKHDFMFHPMVSADNVHLWISNYDWFESMCIAYDYSFPRSVMMLEVRNDDWNDDSLEHLKDYYRHQIARMWELSNNDMAAFCSMLLGIGDSDRDSGGYSNVALPLARNQAACSIPLTLTVRVGDLSIIPCHRLGYDQYHYGRFTQVDNSISFVEANNPQMMIKCVFSNILLSHHGCDVCAYSGFCMRACFGQQYESGGDPFMPSEKVCKLMQTKFNYLIDTYQEFGVIDYLVNLDPTDASYIYSRQILENIGRIMKVRGDDDV